MSIVDKNFESMGDSVGLLPIVEIPKITQTTIEDFEAYRDTFGDYDITSPQRQGITDIDAFADAIFDPTTVSSSGTRKTIPRLFSTRYVDWLNEDHIIDSYALTDLAVLHIPDSTASLSRYDISRLKSGIAKVLLNGGGIAIDYPDNDQGYVERAEQLIAETGLCFDFTETGTQTYFSGRTKINNPDEWADENRKYDSLEDATTRISRAFSEKEPKVYHDGIVVESTETIDPSLAVPMFEFVNQAFESISDHPCRQAWTEDEFVEVATATPSVVKVVSGQPSRISAVIAFGSNLEDFPWINPTYFTEHYLTDTDEGRHIYFPTIAKDPTDEGMNAMKTLIPFISEGFAAAGQLRVSFDACDKNRKGLPKLIEFAVKSAGICTLKFDEIAQQRYGLFTLKK